MPTKIQKTEQEGPSNDIFRNRLGVILIITSACLLAIPIIMLFFVKKDEETIKYVIAALLPVVSTWIGSVIAFYFGKENFESATRSIRTMVDKLTTETLIEIPVNHIMIDMDTMVKYDLDQEEKLKLDDLKLKFLGKSRLPILIDKKPFKILHSSILNELTTERDRILGETKTLAGKVAELKTFHSNLGGDESWDYNILQNLLKTTKFRDLFGKDETKGFITVSENTKIREARALMLKCEKCHDCFVVKNGEMIGWVTDKMILRFLDLPK